METWWHFHVWKKFNDRVYKQTLTEADITSKPFFLEVIQQVHEDGSVTEEDINKQVVKIEKNGKLYVLLKNYITEMPLNPKTTMNCYLKASDKTIYQLILPDFQTARIKPQKTRNFKQFINEFNPIEHSDPRSKLFMNMVMIATKHKPTKLAICSPPSSGKCHGKGTKILMFDGSTKLVEDIREGELLMGDDSNPRKVLSTICGTGKLFEINPNNGEKYIVNDEHILCLRINNQNNKEIEITTKDYLLRGNDFKHHAMAYKVGVEFPKKEVLIEPYMLGQWLGNGTNIAPSITTMDEESIKEIFEFADRHNLHVRIQHQQNNKSKVYCYSAIKPYKNLFLKSLRKYNLFGKIKHIPKDYLINDKETRLQLLAGLIDTDGHLARKQKGSIETSSFEITQKSKQLADDIVFLTRSVGLSASINVKKVLFNKQNLIYWRIQIGGKINIIPTKVKRKQAEKRYRVGDTLNTSFKIKELGLGTYYGFTLDGNHKYLLGDFTVTHNTSVFNVLRTITNDVCIQRTPTLAVLETILFYNKVILFEELSSLTSTEVRQIEPVIFVGGDGSPEMQKHSLAKNSVMNNIDLTEISFIFPHNRPQDLQKDSKFMLDIWKNPEAFKSRFPCILIEGKVTSQLSTPSKKTSIEVMNMNYSQMLEVSKNVIYYVQKLDEELHHYNRKLLRLTDARQYPNIEGLIDVIDAYCETQTEFDEWIQWLNQRMRAYQQMLQETVMERTTFTKYEEEPRVSEEKIE